MIVTYSDMNDVKVRIEFILTTYTWKIFDIELKIEIWKNIDQILAKISWIINWICQRIDFTVSFNDIHDVMNCYHFPVKLDSYELLGVSMCGSIREGFLSIRLLYSDHHPCQLKFQLPKLEKLHWSLFNFISHWSVCREWRGN